MLSNPFTLAGKKILVTGASSGIGRAISIACSGQGATVLLTARNLEKLKQTFALLEPGEHILMPADFNSDTELDALVAALPELDGLVLNAGILKTLPVQFIKRESLEQIFNVNLYGSVILVQRLLKQKKIKKGASVCFVSSIASLHVTPGNAMYSASKGAVNAFARVLALELAPKQIRVNAVLPGLVETNILHNGPIGYEQLQTHLKNYPIGRFGKPEDVAYLCVYLLSDASSWMTGSLIILDGGFSIK
jgi:NAD(P)-dependent dehydrogenase (short-subunit alcohol dehydrogenase family)